MKKVNLLSREEMKKISGGVADVCQGQTGGDLTNCRYNVCMAGWDSSTHDQEANDNKIDSCCAQSGNC